MWSKSKFLIFASLFIVGAIGSVALLLDHLQRNAFEAEARNRAEVVSCFGKASRKYVKTVMRPAVQQHTDEMIFEAMSSTFVTRGIFDCFNENMPEYRYRQAALDPLNSDNKANAYEREVIAKFVADPKLQELTGNRSVDGQDLFYVARPVIVEAKCIQCHGSPDSVPTAIVERYGSEHGYNWQVGETVAAQMISIPTSDLSTQNASLRQTVLAIFTVLTIVLVCVSYIFFAKSCRHADDVQKARAEAESSNQAKSEFLANMSHEIRTPMTAILGFNDIILENVTKPENIDAARTVRKNGEYLIEIINDILDLSKIEEGKLVAEQISCSPHNIVADVVSLMKVRAVARGLPLVVRFDGALPETIQSDPTRLRQVLINLVGNAIKFSEMGSIQIVTCLLNEPGEEPKLQFDVIDEGIGIPKDKIEKLFLPFTQADNSTTRTFGGTGLGLTISKRLVELLGGQIAVTSTVGKGSTFSVTIATGPLKNVPLLEDVSESSNESSDTTIEQETEFPLRDRRILLAEDGPDNQRLIGFLMKKAGAEVAFADNGQIALDLATAARAENRPFDVILMDMQMPVMDGYEATRRLRSQGYLGPIIAVTAHAMSSDRQKCLDAGCDDYATKPIDRKKLISLLAQHASRKELHTLSESPVE